MSTGKRPRSGSDRSTQEPAACGQTLQDTASRTVLRTRLNSAMASLRSEMVLTENALAELSIQGLLNLAVALEEAVLRLQ